MLFGSYSLLNLLHSDQKIFFIDHRLLHDHTLARRLLALIKDIVYLLIGLWGVYGSRSTFRSLLDRLSSHHNVVLVKRIQGYSLWVWNKTSVLLFLSRSLNHFRRAQIQLLATAYLHALPLVCPINLRTPKAFFRRTSSPCTISWVKNNVCHGRFPFRQLWRCMRDLVLFIGKHWRLREMVTFKDLLSLWRVAIHFIYLLLVWIQTIL